MIQCVICNQKVTSRRGLAFHIKKHDIDSVEKYLETYPDQIQYVEPKDESLLTCPICGKYNFKQLSQHITWIHKMTQDEFKELYPDQKLFIDEISERCKKATLIGREQYYKNKQKDPEKYAERVKERALKRKLNNPDIGKKVSTILREHGVYDRMSDWAKEKWKDPKYRKLQSDKTKKQHENGLTDVIMKNSGKKRYKITLGNKTYSMRSTWEVKFATYLYNNNIDFLYENVVIKYTFNNRVYDYYPDFIIPNTKILFEVKPKNLTNQERNIQKMKASIELGYNFIYITEDVINDLDNFKFPDVK